MRQFLVIEDDADAWSRRVPDTVEVVDARRYLTDPGIAEARRVRVTNLCRSTGYQSLGYYVSLLAEARGHRVVPSLSTLQDLAQAPLTRVVAGPLRGKLPTLLAKETEERVEVTSVFGRSLSGQHEALASLLFRSFPAPIVTATFERRAKTGQWEPVQVRAGDAPGEADPSEPRFVELAAAFFQKPSVASGARRGESAFDLAILVDPSDPDAPSDARALRSFVKAAERFGMSAELIEREDYGRLGQFDGLFIRTTTSVPHFTFRFARKAAAEGLAVIDDPTSILRCTNKVFLAELLRRKGIGTPDTRLLHRRNVEDVGRELGFPLVLKLPDGSSSRGVFRIDDPATLTRTARELLANSELLVAQRFVPTPFDWRVGVLDGRPLYVCRYHMARHHWQIVKRTATGDKLREGGSDTLAVEDAPQKIVETAVRAAALVGDGLYGVDLKEVDGKALVIEINDNPSLDSGIEDRVLGTALYERVMESFLRRIEKLRGLERRT